MVALAGWPARAWSGGFRRAGGVTGFATQVPKPSPDAGRGEALGRGRAFPGQAEVGDGGAGKAQLSVGGQDEPGPAVGGCRVA